MEGKLKGRTIAFTGVLKKYTRRQVRDLVEQLGGNVADSITDKVNYLVLGKEPGSKLEKGGGKDIRILSERQFLKLIE